MLEVTDWEADVTERTVGEALFHLPVLMDQQPDSGEAMRHKTGLRVSVMDLDSAKLHVAMC